jgi:hypothetical protein
VSIAVAAFCIEHPSGSGQTMIHSHETNQILASVTDGNYFD